MPKNIIWAAITVIIVSVPVSACLYISHVSQYHWSVAEYIVIVKQNDSIPAASKVARLIEILPVDYQYHSELVKLQKLVHLAAMP